MYNFPKVLDFRVTGNDAIHCHCRARAEKKRVAGKDSRNDTLPNTDGMKSYANQILFLPSLQKVGSQTLEIWSVSLD